MELTLRVTVGGDDVPKKPMTPEQRAQIDAALTRLGDILKYVPDAEPPSPRT